MTNNPTAILCLLLSCLSVVQAAGGRGTVFGVVPEREHAGQGVAVNRVAEQTPAQLAGLQSGDVIVSVQGIPTPTATELKAALAEFAPGDAEFALKWTKNIPNMASRYIRAILPNFIVKR